MSSSKSLSSLSGGEDTAPSKHGPSPPKPKDAFPESPDLFLSGPEKARLAREHQEILPGSDDLAAPLPRVESRWWVPWAVLTAAAASLAMFADRWSFWAKVPMVTGLAGAALTAAYASLVISRWLKFRDAKRLGVIAKLSFKELGDAGCGTVRVLGFLIRYDGAPGRYREPSEVAFRSGRFDLGPRLSELMADPAWLDHAYQRVGALRYATRGVVAKWGSLLQGSSAGFGWLDDYAEFLEAISKLRRILDDCRNERDELSERQQGLRAAWENADAIARRLANTFWRRAASRQRFLDPSKIPPGADRRVFNSIVVPHSGQAEPLPDFMRTRLEFAVSVLAILVPFAVGAFTLMTM